jgi:hypothetical protein
VLADKPAKIPLLQAAKLRFGTATQPELRLQRFSGVTNSISKLKMIGTHEDLICTTVHTDHAWIAAADIIRK